MPRPALRFNAALCVSALALFPSSLIAQVAPQPAEDEEPIVVTGQRERGSVAGDILPEAQLRPADVRALGVSNVAELINELGPQLRSAGGNGPPVVLLEGRRVSGFQEIAQLPAEAISRVDILPEAVALRYGFPADQKVVNVVLRERFRAFTAEADVRLATQGGTATPELKLGLLRLGKGRRTTLDVALQTTSTLLEIERGLVTDPATQGNGRALRPWQQRVTIDGSTSHPLDEQTTLTLSGGLSATDSRRQTGLARGIATLPAGSAFNPGSDPLAVSFVAANLPPLASDTGTETGRLALTVQREGAPWRWTLTAAYDRSDSRTIITRGLDLTAYQAAALAGLASANPALPLAPAYTAIRPADDARSASDTARVDATTSGRLGRMPAGDISISLTAQGLTQRFASNALRSGVAKSSQLTRNLGSGQASIDIPIARRSRAVLAPLGDLSLNANATVQSLSDAGGLRILGAGFNWSPLRPLSLIGTFNTTDSAPSVNQIGDPQTVTPGIVYFDYARGTSSLVAVTSGGNPSLLPTRRDQLRLSGTLKLGGPLDVTLNAAWSDTRMRNSIIALPASTAAVQAAFPERFARDAGGALTGVDSRAINLFQRNRQELRWGISINKTLKTPQWQVDAMRAAMRRQFPNGLPSGITPPGMTSLGGGPPTSQPSPSSQNGEARGAGQPNGAGRGFGGGGRGFGGGGGRLSFSLQHSWHIMDKARLRAGAPEIDLLAGETLGTGNASSGVQPRHELELQAGLFIAGSGLRMTGNWQSASRVNGGVAGPAGTLRYAPLGLINLRLFANTGQLPGLGLRHRALRGTRVQLGVDNLFNRRPRVTDPAGVTPIALQGAYFDPVGRTIRINLRKMF
jgi:iron complex outermembrane recepter protein